MKYLILFFFTVFSFGQQISKVDFIKCNALVQPNFETKSVNGKVTYDFKVISEIDSIRIDAINMDFDKVLINGKSVNYKNNKKEIILFEGFKKGKNKVSFEYKCTPKQTIYFTGIGDGRQIWTQGQGKYTSHWLPSFDEVIEKVIFNVSINYDKNFTAFSNGKFKNANTKRNGILNYNNYTWNFEMQKPMSSYLVMLAIGKFNHKTEKSQSGIPLENYYKAADEDKYQHTYKYSTAIFDFLEKEIGVKYPWEIYRQVPVDDFLYAGMENTSSTLFSQEFVVDESGYNDRNYINVNAHELAHQWFGDLVTAKSGKHHWLQEGFATYYALLAERELFGDDYFYNALYRTSLQLRAAAKTDTIPVLNEKASSLSFYQKGAWALHCIREEIGAKTFQKAVKSYLKKYAFKNVETADFLNEIAKVSNFDVVKFQKKWLEDYRFPTEEANALLMKSSFYRKLSEINSFKSKSFAEKEIYFSEIMQSNDYFILKKEIIYQIEDIPFEQKKKLIDLAMKTGNIEVRQAVAETINIIPLSFKMDYELLLNDKSYDTKKRALLTLWKNFPEDHAQYLEIAKNWVGKNDKELRILFLTLYQLYPNAEEDKKAMYFNELVDYTSSKYESSVRQNALESALEIDSKNEIVLRNLVNATIHHKWQFVKYGRETIRELIKDNNYPELFLKLMPTFNALEKVQLERILNPK